MSKEIRMDLSRIKLHGLGLWARLSVTCLILVLAGGYLTSALHLWHHYENKDEQPGLTMDDLIGSFHGMNQPARLLTAVQGTMRQYLPDEEEYQSIIQWLESDRISEDYDSLELGDFAPAEILAIRCLNCHSRESVEATGADADKVIPLEYWDDVKQVAFPKNLDPVPIPILITSTHTHALTMPVVAVVTALLFLATAWPRSLRRFVVFLFFFALLLDVGSWWLARVWAPACYLIVLGGGLFGALAGLQLLGAFLDTWLGGLFSKATDQKSQ
jgi:hypothetical protein